MRISVVIPLYNKKESVIAAVRSILHQAMLPIEIIVVNDGSTDGSELEVEQMNHPLIRVINQENEGVSAARNKGILEAEGDWIAFLDADDYWDTRFLQTMAVLHSHFPGANVLASNYRYQNIKGVFSQTTLRNLSFPNENYGIFNNYFEVASASSPPICNSAVVVRKEALINIGMFPIGVKAGEDLIAWAKLAVNETIAYTVEPLSTFVLDGAHSFHNEPKRKPDSLDPVGRQLKSLLSLNPSVIGLNSYVAHWHKMRASIFLRLGSRRLSLIEIFKSLKYDSYQLKLFVYILLLPLPNKLTLYIFRKVNNV